MSTIKNVGILLFWGVFLVLLDVFYFTKPFLCLLPMVKKIYIPPHKTNRFNSIFVNKMMSNRIC